MDKILNQGTAKLAPMTCKEASAYIGFSVSTLKKWRQNKMLPKYVIYNNRPYYQKADLDEFLKHCFDGDKAV